MSRPDFGVPANKQLICLSGPTASGKSAAVLALAQRWPIEIIAMDSATIYCGMDIGTAKPTAADRAAVPHHLLDIRDPAESYSAAEFVNDASKLVQDILDREHIPILCGGTLMYYRAIREGLHMLPSATPDIRATINARASRLGWPALHAELGRIDATTAARLEPNDSQRIQRALEIWYSSGRSMSQWLQDAPQNPFESFHHALISLEPAVRPQLHDRIAHRFQTMLDTGLLDEVAGLFARKDLHKGLPAIRSVGYRQLWDHLGGLISLPQAKMQAIYASRQLAKRQMTWLRRWPQRKPLDCLSDQLQPQLIDCFAHLLNFPGAG